MFTVTGEGGGKKHKHHTITYSFFLRGLVEIVDPDKQRIIHDFETFQNATITLYRFHQRAVRVGL